MKQNTENNCETVPEFRSANLHICGACNYNCEHCFSRNLSLKEMEPEAWTPVLEHLRETGVTKINFAGGEPTLYRGFETLCRNVKQMGFTVSVVSNGSRMDAEWIERFTGIVDWIGLSVDSTDDADEIAIGRHLKGGNHVEHVVEVAELAHRAGIRVKLNITVVRRSWNKDFHSLVARMNPQRVKVFRVLTLEGANTDRPDVWSITDGQWETFKSNHADIEGVCFEDNDDMVGSYLMFDPLGRWMLNNNAVREFEDFRALVQHGTASKLDVEKYLARGGEYSWE